VRNESKVDTEFLDAAKKTQVIGRLGVGLDNIDLKGARDRNIPVISARNANATSVAEYVIACMLDASRPLNKADEVVRKGTVKRKHFTGTKLNGRVLELIVMWEISLRVAKRAKAFGIEVIGYDPFVAPFDHVVQDNGIKQRETADEVIKGADFVSIHVPLTDDTRYLF